jgi:hypothetical protein
MLVNGSPDLYGASREHARDGACATAARPGRPGSIREVGTLSSAILYLAIVAIWAVVLVPRWLRPRHAPPVPVPAEAADATVRESPSPDGVPVRPAGTDSVTLGAHGPGEVAVEASAEGVPRDRGEPADAAPEREEASAPAPASRRTEVVKARRRLLTTLVTLTIIAVACAVTRIDAYWIIIPPAVLLAGYLVLLRKFAQFDTERARRAARARQAADGGRAAQRPPSAPESSPAEPQPAAGDGPDSVADPAGPVPGAEIIDISGRITDQVYDQYSDAANRAVGD